MALQGNKVKLFNIIKRVLIIVMLFKSVHIAYFWYWYVNFRYIEHGVVSPVVHPEGNHGLALSPVLFGIAASKYASRESTESLLRLLRPYSNVGESDSDLLFSLFIRWVKFII